VIRFLKNGIEVTPKKFTAMPTWKIESEKEPSMYEPVRKEEKEGLSRE
jgi:hypothetical protein